VSEFADGEPVEQAMDGAHDVVGEGVDAAVDAAVDTDLDEPMGEGVDAAVDTDLDEPMDEPIEVPDPPLTGDPAVDDATAAVARAVGEPLATLVNVIEAAHRVLQDRLADVEG
jgi:hypothetical protein